MSNFVKIKHLELSYNILFIMIYCVMLWSTLLVGNAVLLGMNYADIYK